MSLKDTRGLTQSVDELDRFRTTLTNSQSSPQAASNPNGADLSAEVDPLSSRERRCEISQSVHQPLELCQGNDRDLIFVAHDLGQCPIDRGLAGYQLKVFLTGTTIAPPQYPIPQLVGPAATSFLFTLISGLSYDFSITSSDNAGNNGSSATLTNVRAP